jgi:hypothetical protein
VRLEYELAGDATQIKRVLRGVEAEAKASNRRMARDAQQSTSSVARRVSTGTSRAEVQQVKQIERERLRAVENEKRARLRADREVAQAASSLDRQRSRGLMQQFREAERAAVRQASASSRTAQRVRGGAASMIGAGIGGVARMGGTAAAVAGGFGAASALSESFSVQRRASQLAISGGVPEQRGALAQEALGVKGFTGTETLGAMQGFVEKTGDLGAARALIQDIGKLSLATSADFEEMGSAAGQAFNVIRDTIKDPKEQIKAVNDVMRTLAAQGNLGAVEIKDMATELAGLGAATRKFEGGPVELLKTVGAMAQASVARGGAASAPEATTAVTRFAQDIVQNQGKFAAADIGIFSDASKTKLRGPEDIMLDVLEKTQGDLTKINAMFGVYAERAVGGFSPLFIDSEKQKKGSGRAAVKAEFKKFKEAGLTDAQVNERAGVRMGDDDLQIKEAMKVFNQAVGQHLAPAAGQLAKNFSELAPLAGGLARALGRFVGFLAENPVAGVGAIVGVSIAKEIASAGLANIISGEISGKLGAALSGLGAGLSIATMIVTANVLNFEKREASIGVGGKALGTARELAQRGDAAGLEKMITEQKDRISAAKKEGFVESTLKGAGSFVGSLGGLRQMSPEQKARIEERSQLLDQNKQVEIRSQEGFLLEMENLRKAAAAAAGEMAKVKAPGGPEASRVAPINSPSRG